MSEQGKMVRLVRCPKCYELLPELANFSVSQCGACGTVLRGKGRVQELIAAEKETDLIKPVTPPLSPHRAYTCSSPSDSSQLCSALPELNFSDLERVEMIGNGHYRVCHLPTSEFYVLRVIRCDDDFSVRRQIQQEMENLGELKHPNLVNCYGLLVGAGEIQVLLDYMNGGSLEGIHIPDESFLADLTLQTLSGLAYLHERKIVHRDIKPSSIFKHSNPSTETGQQFKIANTGLCRILALNAVLCDREPSSIAYMSPERINTDLDKVLYDGYAGDIWGLGLSILELYLGRYPFDVVKDRDWASIATVICMSEPPKAPPTASGEFRDFIDCCLQRDLLKRWTAQQLLQHPFILRHNHARDDQMSMEPTIPVNVTRKTHLGPSPLMGLPHKRKGASLFSKREKIQHVPTVISAPIGEFCQMVMGLTGAGSSHEIIGGAEVYRKAEIEAEAKAVLKPESEGLQLMTDFGTDKPLLHPVGLLDKAMCNGDRFPKSCGLYCSLFPPGYQFQKDDLVQLWIAEGLIEAKGNERMEDVGSQYFDYMSNQKLVVPCGFDQFANQVTYRVGEAMDSILVGEPLAPMYCRVEDNKLTDVFLLSTRLSLICEDIDKMNFEALKKCRGLRTLLLLCKYGSSVKQVPRDLFLILKSLRVLKLSHTHIYELPSSVGNLKSLRYLDLSETPIKQLPESVDCLHNLQTLRLRGCLVLTKLPKYISKLVNLRHLDLDIACQLKGMPKGMGSLTNLQTLRAFLIGKEDGCRIGELKSMDSLSGSLCISRLENVLHKNEAKESCLSEKKYLIKLVLRWDDTRDGVDGNEEGILECLQPHFDLKELEILFYRGSMLPSWISSVSFVRMANITLYNCSNLCVLPSIGELPSLKVLNLVGMDRLRNINGLFCKKRDTQGNHAFPKLEKLTLDSMFNLEEWTGVENGDFPCLLHLTVKYCPRLISLPLLSCLNSLKHLEISYCAAFSSFPEEKLPVSLEFLLVRDCPLLMERCRKGEGADWLKIAHVCHVWIGNQEVSELSMEDNRNFA